MAGLVDLWTAVIRAALKLPVDPGEPPDLMRLGLYEARVDVCATDGSTLDVTPNDKRLPPAKGVKLKAGIPGAVATVQAGAVVLLGWERGDPGSPYCVPCWSSGATVVKLVLNAQAIYLGGESGADKICRKSDFDSHTHAAGTLSAPGGGGAVTGATAGAVAITGTSITQAK